MSASLCEDAQGVFLTQNFMYSFKRTEFSPYELYTVGTYDSGKWEPESDHATKEQAAERVHFLNGGRPPKFDKSLDEILDKLERGTISVEQAKAKIKILFQ